MSLCCIGGVCIPYTALLPLAAWCCRWVITKLGLAQYLPASITALLNVPVKGKEASSSVSSASCCITAPTSRSSTGLSDCCDNKDGLGLVRSIESPEEWKVVLEGKSSKNINNNTAVVVVVAKFTADWCRPCQALQPTVEQLAQDYSSAATFVSVNVDEVDQVAAEYSVAILPTILILKDGVQVDRYTGSNAAIITELVRVHCSNKKTE